MAQGDVGPEGEAELDTEGDRARWQAEAGRKGPGRNEAKSDGRPATQGPVYKMDLRR